ncbi:hypothetical protein ACI1VM_25460, partial [Escherichia coli]
MSHHDSVRAQLHAIEALMRQHQLWQDNAPQPVPYTPLPLPPKAEGKSLGAALDPKKKQNTLA